VCGGVCVGVCPNATMNARCSALTVRQCASVENFHFFFSYTRLEKHTHTHTTAYIIYIYLYSTIYVKTTDPSSATSAREDTSCARYAAGTYLYVFMYFSKIT